MGPLRPPRRGADGRVRRVYDRYLVVEDIYPDVARKLRADGCRRFADLGGGRGELCWLLAGSGVQTVLVDLDEQMLAEGTRPAVGADVAALPLADASVDAAAAINCLYFLAEPLVGIREAHRVLAPGGTFVASSPSRWNDPELRDVDPRWGRASPFDSEDSPALVAAVFGDVEVESWELVAYRLPDTAAIHDYLHAFDVPNWRAHARTRSRHRSRSPRSAPTSGRREVAIALSSTARRGVRRRPYVPFWRGQCAPDGRDLERAFGASSRNEGMSRNGRSLASGSSLVRGPPASLACAYGCSVARGEFVDPHGSELRCPGTVERLPVRSIARVPIDVVTGIPVGIEQPGIARIHQCFFGTALVTVR